MCSTSRISGVILLVVVLFPSRLGAQPTADFADLQQILKVGQLVIVTDSNGQKTQGKVTKISASSLEVLSRHPRTFEEKSVSEVRRTDSVWNGVLIGAAAGGAVAAAGFLATQGQSDSVYGWAYVGAWLAPAAGAIGGWLVDKHIRSGPVYQAVPATRVSLVIRTSPGDHQGSVCLSLRF